MYAHTQTHNTIASFHLPVARIQRGKGKRVVQLPWLPKGCQAAGMMVGKEEEEDEEEEREEGSPVDRSFLRQPDGQNKCDISRCV